MDREENKAATTEWLRRMASAEDKCESISAGGLASELGMLRSQARPELSVFGRLIEFMRRDRGLSAEKLAEQADVDLGELLAIERYAAWRPTPRAVYKLAQAFGVATSKFLELAGLSEARDETLSDAALRFAARSEPITQLSKAEHDALDEFVKVLVDTSEGG